MASRIGSLLLSCVLGVMLAGCACSPSEESGIDTSQNQIEGSGISDAEAASGADAQEEQELDSDESASQQGSGVADGSLMSAFTPLSQYPELPTGCEMTSLAMTLCYYGLEADKCDLADNYLEKGEVGTVDFREAFEGDPRDEDSYGCYAPVVVNTANSYLEAQGSTLRAREISGMELESLYPYVDEGTPVIVWGTQDCAEGHYSVTWNVNGQDLTWFTPEHCMVFVGYDDGEIYVADPIYGDIRSYGIDEFKASYDSLGKQAVIIE